MCLGLEWGLHRGHGFQVPVREGSELPGQVSFPGFPHAESGEPEACVFCRTFLLGPGLEPGPQGLLRPHGGAQRTEA